MRKLCARASGGSLNGADMYTNPVFIAIDLETTGFDPARSEIIEIAAVKFDPHAAEGHISETFETLVKPSTSLSIELKRLTGLQDDDFDRAPDLPQGLKLFRDFISREPLVGHNIPFDIGFLKPVFPEIENFEFYDSFVLSRVLLLRETSYALDQLCKKFEIPQEESHRALPDAKATALLFQKLVRLAQSTPEETFRKLSTLFQKTDWPYKKFFAGLNMAETASGAAQARVSWVPELVPPERKGANPERSEGELVGETVGFHQNNQKFFAGLNMAAGTAAGTAASTAEKNKLLYETPCFPDLSQLSKIFGPLLFAYGRSRSEFENFPILHEETHYISPEKLDNLLRAQQTFDHEFAAFLTKIILFEAQTKTGLRHELSLHGKEWVFFELISGEGRFFHEALEQAKKSPSVCVPHASLPALGAREEIMKDRNIVIGDALLLEETLTSHFEKRFSLEKFEATALFQQTQGDAGRIQILFGLLGMYYQTHADADQRTDLLLPLDFGNTPEEKRIVECAVDIPGLEELAKILQAPNPASVRWLSFYRDQIVVHEAPLKFDAALCEITRHAKKVMLFDHALSLDSNFSFFNKLFDLHDFDAVISPHDEFQKIDWSVPERLPEPNTEGYFQACASIIEETIEESGGGLVAIFHTRKALEAHFEALIEKHVASKVQIFAQRKTGGLGKNIDQFLEQPEKSVFFATTDIFPHMEKLAPAINVLIFQKIPFEFSFHPLAKKRQEMWKDGFNKYTLQKALLRLKRFLSVWAMLEGRKKLIFLDPRLLKKEFGALLKELSLLYNSN